MQLPGDTTAPAAPVPAPTPAPAADSAVRPPSAAGFVKGLAGTLLLLQVGLMFANVVARHLFAAPFFWAEEITVYLNIWCVMIALVLVSLDQAHLRMDLLLNALPPAARRAAQALTLVLTLVACAGVLTGSLLLLKHLHASELRSVAVGLPMVWVHAAVFVGFAAMAVVTAFGWRRALAPPPPMQELVP